MNYEEKQAILGAVHALVIIFNGALLLISLIYGLLTLPHLNAGASLGMSFGLWGMICARSGMRFTELLHEQERWERQRRRKNIP